MAKKSTGNGKKANESDGSAEEKWTESRQKDSEDSLEYANDEK
jgi:hypothetical protein